MASIAINEHVEIASVLVALATLVLAFITWRLARTAARSTIAAERSTAVSERAADVAERSANAAERTARVAQIDIDSIDMPYVIATATPAELLPVIRASVLRPRDIHRARGSTLGDWVLRCRLSNIGSGPAIVHEVGLQSDDEELVSGLASHIPLAAGSAYDVEIPSPRWRTPGAGALRIEYTHSNGKRYATTSEVTIDGDLLWCRTYGRSEIASE